jgi:mRNA-degrading endonuclease RelE of RelBE toxin-antitoxin system
VRDVRLTAGARRSLAALPPKAANVVIPFIRDVIAADPFTVGKPLRWELEGLHSARRGDYGVIYTMDVDTVTIVRVDHRSDAYRAL